MILLLICIGTILYMSRCAENRKAEHPENAQASSPQGTVTSNDASKSAESADKSMHRPDFIDTFTWPEGATVWALLLTLIVIAWQSAETRNAAKAALMQAEHVEVTERAWLLINYVDMRGTEFKDGESVSSRWTIKNVGSTPAILLETKARFYITSIYPEMIEDPAKELAESPSYGDPVVINARLLAPNDSIGYFTKWEQRVDEKFVEFTFPARADRVWMIIAYGYVKYRDTFGKDHESRSCDFICISRNDQIVMDWIPSPKTPPAYNRCT